MDTSCCSAGRTQADGVHASPSVHASHEHAVAALVLQADPEAALPGCDNGVDHVLRDLLIDGAQGIDDGVRGRGPVDARRDALHWDEQQPWDLRQY